MKKFSTISCVIMLSLSIIGFILAIVLNDADMMQNAWLALIAGHCTLIEGKLDKED